MDHHDIEGSSRSAGIAKCMPGNVTRRTSCTHLSSIKQDRSRKTHGIKHCQVLLALGSSQIHCRALGPGLAFHSLSKCSSNFVCSDLLAAEHSGGGAHGRSAVHDLERIHIPCVMPQSKDHLPRIYPEQDIADRAFVSRLDPVPFLYREYRSDKTGRCHASASES